jgi:glycosyltransferase involved in cell wall biosynthesis
MIGPVTVAHIITHLGVGGAQQTVARLCRGLDRVRFRPIIVAGVAPAGSVELFATTDIDRDDPTIVRIRSLVRPVRPMRDLRAIGDVRSVLRSEGVEIVHTHSSKAGLIGRAAALSAGTPHVVHTVHGWAVRSQIRRPTWSAFTAAERMLARRTDALVVVSETDRRLGLGFGIGEPDQYHLIRSGIRVAEFADASRDRPSARRQLGLAPDARVVGTVTRLAPPKDTETLLAGFAAIRRHDPEVRFVVVGDGPGAAAARDQASRLGLDGSIIWTGVRRDVERLLPAFDVAVLASLDEGLPRSIVEAMAAGVPVVASDVGAVHEVVIDGRTGRLVPPRDPEALASGVLALLADPESAALVAGAARASVVQFDEAAMIEATEALYESMLGTRAAEVPVQ